MLQSFIRAVPPPSTGITLVSTATSTSSSQTLVLTKPSGVQAGDLLVAVTAASTGGSTNTWTPDTGWTKAITGNQSSPNLGVTYKTAGSSEPSTYTFSSGPGGVSTANGIVLCFRGAQWDTIGALTAGHVSGVQTASAITVGANNSYLVAVFTRTTSSSTWSNASAGLVSIAYSATNPSLQLYGDDLYPQGSSGTKSATVNATTSNLACVLFSVKPV